MDAITKEVGEGLAHLESLESEEQLAAFVKGACQILCRDAAAPTAGAVIGRCICRARNAFTFSLLESMCDGRAAISDPGRNVSFAAAVCRVVHIFAMIACSRHVTPLFPRRFRRPRRGCRRGKAIVRCHLQRARGGGQGRCQR